MTLATQTKFFDNYTRLKQPLPMTFWYVARSVVLAGTIGLAALLAFAPDIGLKVFWGIVIPSVPITLVIIPGLWRQICPMAFLNQIPRMYGFSQERTLPEMAKSYAFTIALIGFIGPVAIRGPILNQNGLIVAIVIIVALALAFTGGLFFKGRSGWCGTFCPLGPIQRTYGQAPIVVLPNGYCTPCVGCQKNCYDFNPRAAIFSDVYDDDPRYASQRRFFMGLLPGLIIGYFSQGVAPTFMPDYGEPLHILIILGACCASVGVYGLATSFIPVNPFRISAIFGAVALVIFYWYSGPTILNNICYFLGTAPPSWLTDAMRSIGVIGALTLMGSGFRSELQYAASRRQSEQPVRDGGQTTLKQRLGSSGNKEVTDRSSGVTFQVGSGASLLDAIQSAGLKINYGCRAGVCGADAVAICDGGENLSPPGDDELATLRRMGLEGRARLACVCQVKGPVVIDRDPNSAQGKAELKAKPTTIDKAKLAGVSRVVIIGNGIAGMSAAEALRRDSGSVEVTMVTDEPAQFYNRMAIGRLIYDGSGMDGLQLVPDTWFTSNNVTVMRNTVAAGIDREARQVVLATGDKLPYDKLILATGARSMSPDPKFLQYSNAFVLRTMEDAQAIRSFVQRTRAKRAVVIGGGVLGVEAADALHHLGLQVVILQRSDRLMNAQLDEPGAAKLSNYLESIGVQVVTDVTVTRFDGTTAINSAWLSHGPRVRADLFVACLGIETNKFLASKAGLETGRGIKVNANMQTGDPNIYAIGDVAEVPGSMGGLWPIGAAHAGTAVSSIFGTPTPYSMPRIVLRLKCDGVDLHSYGDINPAPDIEEITASPADRAWWRLHLRNGELVGGLFVGPPNTGRTFAKILQTPADFGAIRDQLRNGHHEVLNS